ncbi:MULTISPECIES: hypothetical protein [unclassified Mesorhizobium]|uniref:hypothetical protein n=1 Tax=unclassified Mesorhizobium TaxID=325217 RepID=UPI0019CF9730|nr:MULTISPECIES: hypothetical protein [unclassified Mesorhizobium]
MTASTTMAIRLSSETKLKLERIAADTRRQSVVILRVIRTSRDWPSEEWPS